MNAGMADAALDGQAGQLGPAPTHLAGRPAPIAQAPALAEATVSSELVGVTATVSGRMRRWRDSTGHPRPPRNYRLV